jgi:hypothetical protein
MDEDVGAFCHLLLLYELIPNTLSSLDAARSVGICKKSRPYTEFTAAVVGLNVDRSRAGIPHDLGIHRSLVTFRISQGTLVCSKSLCQLPSAADCSGKPN